MSNSAKLVSAGLALTLVGAIQGKIGSVTWWASLPIAAVAWWVLAGLASKADRWDREVRP